MSEIRTSILGAVVVSIACGASDPNLGETGSTSTDATTMPTSSSPTNTTNEPTSTSSGDPSTGTTTQSADSSSGSGSTGDEPVVFDGACPLETRVGGFILLAEADYTAFSGTVADGVVPITVLEPVGEGDGCTLLRRNNPFCDPLCMPGTTCDFDGTCIPYPANHDVGVVTVSGLLQAVEIDPTPPNFNYFDTNLDHPAWAPDSPMELRAAGGDYDAFELHGRGVEMIEPTFPELSMAVDQPLEVEWTPGGGGARVYLALNVDQHGLTPVTLVCEVEDNGSLEVPAELITDFLAFGISGYPVTHYYRQTADSVEIAPGCVDFLVRTHRQTPLTVEGHTPCDSPDDCPDGETCDLLIQTCV
jgi:hypothetical protein